MQKILVTTDFSANSKAGLRFAIQLASQHKYELTFFHSYYLVKPTAWSDATFQSHKKVETKKIQDQLNNFVDAVYKSMNIIPRNSKCIIINSVFVDANIREYAAQNKFNYICISTRGAGKLKKMFGTNTSNLINQSDVPVIAVPSSYRSKKITNILYASDLTRLEKELKQVVDFAKPIKARVELLHFMSPLEIITDSKIIETAVKKFSKYDIKLHLENPNHIETLITNIESAIKKSKPSMVIMFTQQNRTFFEKLFQSSKSAEYSFNAKVPVLVFNKI
ncbi:MAG: universal stress protein [bacterium]|nr:universal stress protein [bacterium]